MHPTDIENTGIYPGILGAHWQDLAKVIRKIHIAALHIPVHGRFQVIHGPGKIARILARLLRFPVESDQVDITLSVVSKSNGEIWQRTFDQVHLVTSQQAGPPGIMKERMGLLELWFQLEVIEGALHYRQKTAGVPVGLLFIPLPRLLQPVVSAHEAPGGQAGQMKVDVSISLPVLGPLLSYHGYLTLPEIPS